MDDEDTWMNPQPVSWVYKAPDYSKEPYLIERCRRLPVTGNVSFIEQWDVWSRHATKTDRDAELAKLRKEHRWKLRPSRVDFLGVRHVEQDEDAILAQAAAIMARRAIENSSH